MESIEEKLRKLQEAFSDSLQFQKEELEEPAPSQVTVESSTPPEPPNSEPLKVEIPKTETPKPAPPIILALQPSDKRIDNNPAREPMEERTKKLASEIVADTASALHRQEEDRRGKVQQAMQASQPRTQTNQPQVDGGTMVASNLAPQIGTDNADLKTGRVDIRRLTKIPPETVPQFATLLTIKLMREHPEMIIDIYGTWAENVLNLSRSGDGWGMNKVIEMQGASVPGVRAQKGEPKAPNILARNLYDRNWKEKAENE